MPSTSSSTKPAARVPSLVNSLARDVRDGVRRLARDWRFTAGAVCILALGIGGTTAVFSLVNAVLLRPQYVEAPDRLVELYQRGVNAEGIDGNTFPAYQDMAAEGGVFAAVTAFSVPLGVRYQDGGALRPAVVEYATASYLSVLGLRPSIGRWFDPAEDAAGTEVVAVVGHTAWLRRFGGDPSFVGRTVRIEGVPVRIVGVGPAGHAGSINVGVTTDFWLPVQSLPALGAPASLLSRKPAEAGFFVKARLRDGVSVAQAQAAMDILGTRLAAEYPNEDPGHGIRVVASSEVRVHPQLDAVLGWMAAVLLCVVGLVLAIACSNLATLTLVRSAARAKDISLRLALGATRGQLVRQMLTESLLLSGAGGVAGGLLAWWGIRWIGTLDLPVGLLLGVDVRVLGFTVLLACATGLASGLAPARHATRVDIVPTLRDEGDGPGGGRRWFTLKHALIVGQVTVSVLLLGLTSLFVQMLSVSRSMQSGFAVDGVAVLSTDTRYTGIAAANSAALYEEVRRRVAALPGVQATTLSRGRPMAAAGRRLVADGAANGGAVIAAAGIWAGPGYFDTLGIRLLTGRAPDERDGPNAPRVAVISETLAREAFGTTNALGRRIRTDQEHAEWMEIVGVAQDTGTADLAGDLVDPTLRLIYRPPAQWGEGASTLIARTSGDAAALVGAMQRELAQVNPMLPVLDAKTMAQILEESLQASKALAVGLTTLGALGLSLAGLGLYAVVAFAVSRRSREIGIRMALGARGREVSWAVTRDVAALVGVGTALGLALSLAAILALRSVVAPAPGISFYRPTADPLALAGIAAFMAVAAIAAAYLPARRAARLDPLTVIRHT